MFGYTADIGQLRAATAELDTALIRAYDLVREIDSLAVPADSFGAIGGAVASTYTGLHQRKVAALDSVVLRLRDAGGMVAAVADMYQARDDATADTLRAAMRSW